MVKTEDDVDRGGESVMHVFLYNGRDGTGGRNFPETASPRLTRGRYSRYR